MEKILGNTAYKEQVDRLGVIAFVPNGVSMWPHLKNHGQSVVVEKKKERLKKYDVGFYTRANGACVLHRVLEVTDDGYVMCGDSQFVTEKVKEDSVFGVMIGFYVKDKYLSANDSKYIKRVERWYAHKTYRKFRVSIFMFSRRVINKIKRIFKLEKKQSV